MASAHGQRTAAVAAANMLAQGNAIDQSLLQTGYDNAKQDVNTNATSALGAIGTNYDNARAAYGNAATYLQPYADAGTNALGTYTDSLGLNGAGGNAQATAAFQASPGYQWDVDQSTDAVARKQAALGIAGSGNTMAAVQDRANDLADQEYGNWQNRLSGVANTGQQAATTQAGLEKGQGDLDAQQGNATAGLYTGLGSTLGSLDTGLANGQVASNLSATTSAANDGIQAGQAADAANNANQNLLLGGLGLGVNLLTGGAKSGSGVLSNIGKWFS